MKKIMMIILSVLLAGLTAISASAAGLWQEDSAAVTADEAIAAYQAQTGEQVATRRYYFQMPDGEHGFCDEDGNPEESWYNEYSDGAGVYWWGNYPAACASWPGYRAMTADEDQHIYYVNMPVEVETFIWNNGVDGGKDTSLPIYSMAHQTVSFFCEPAEPGDYDTMPEGCDNFDECICIVKPKVPTTAVLFPLLPVEGDWYFYYGNGCYGMYDETSPNFKSAEENCCNPDHFDADGKHIGYSSENMRRGDYDFDGDITIMDATRVQNMIAGLTTRPSNQVLAQIDADGDKELTILDATRVQNVIAQLMTMDGHRIG